MLLQKVAGWHEIMRCFFLKKNGFFKYAIYLGQTLK